MDYYVDFLDASGLLHGAAGEHGDATYARRGDAVGEDGGASGASAAG